MFLDFQNRLSKLLSLKKQPGLKKIQVVNDLKKDTYHCTNTKCKFIKYLKTYHCAKKTIFRLQGKRCIVCEKNPGFANLVITKNNKLIIKQNE